MKRIVKGISLFTAFVLVLGTVGCGSSSKSSFAEMPQMATESAYDEALYDSKSFAGSGAEFNENSIAEESAASQEVTDTSRKLITTMNISAETDNLDSVLASVQKRVKELGGYIEASSVYNGSYYYGRETRDASLTIRIPSDKLDSFITAVEDETNITNKSTSVEDVTLHYVDIESRKNALKAEEKRLLEIVESAETVEDIITVEERLADVRYELESIESQLRTYDNRINYSTVYLDIQEVKKFTDTQPKSAFERMGEGFMDSVDEVISAIVEFFIWIVVHIPQLIICLLLIVILIIVIKAIDKAGKKKKLKKMQMMPANQQVYSAQQMQNVYQQVSSQGYQAPAHNQAQSQAQGQASAPSQEQNKDKE